MVQVWLQAQPSESILQKCLPRMSEPLAEARRLESRLDVRCHQVNGGWQFYVNGALPVKGTCSFI